MSHILHALKTRILHANNSHMNVFCRIGISFTYECLIGMTFIGMLIRHNGCLKTCHTTRSHLNRLHANRTHLLHANQTDGLHANQTDGLHANKTCHTYECVMSRI